jgi:predicted DNA-binding antitoxin AbrB/MazE fold protein
LKINKGQDSILKPTLESVNIDEGAKSFQVNLVLRHGDKVRAEIEVQSLENGVMKFKEKLSAIEDVTTVEVHTCFWGVLNNPKWIFENGMRVITLDTTKHEIEALSGKNVLDSAEKIVIDGRLEFLSEKPLSVYYQSSKHAERARVTDSISLNRIEAEKVWKAGDIISVNEFAPTGYGAIAPFFQPGPFLCIKTR